MTVMTTGDAIVESLIAHGVDTVFGIPGAHMYDFNDALARRADGFASSPRAMNRVRATWRSATRNPPGAWASTPSCRARGY